MIFSYSSNYNLWNIKKIHYWGKFSQKNVKRILELVQFLLENRKTLNNLSSAFAFGVMIKTLIISIYIYAQGQKILYLPSIFHIKRENWRIGEEWGFGFFAYGTSMCHQRCALLFSISYFTYYNIVRLHNITSLSSFFDTIRGEFSSLSFHFLQIHQMIC